MKKIQRFLLIFLLLSCQSLWSQERTISGIVTDSLQSPLPWANVIAIPLDKEQEMKFALTDDKGRYKIILLEKMSYDISVSYLGYEKYKVLLPEGSENQTLHIALKQSSNLLSEVIILDQPVRKSHDTLSYNVEAFRTGDERKLKDLVEKLPGIELDKEGTITVQGKKVTKLTVDGKDFFGSSTKLAVDNIPSDAVNGIDFVDKYQSVGFLHDFDESDELAMNVKLKKDKKKFAFGSIEAGTDINKHYTGHSDLFYYSPRTNINLIGNLDNAGQEFFTYRNVLDFEGGVSSLLNESVFTNTYSELNNLIQNQYFTTRENKFGALNLSTNVNKKLKFSFYTLATGTLMGISNQLTKQYLLDEMSYTENLTQNGMNNNRFGICKIALDYKPSDDESITSQTKLNYTENDDKNDAHSSIDQNDLEFSTIRPDDALTINHIVEWHKRISRDRAISAGLKYNYRKKNSGQSWMSDQDNFSGLLLLEPDTQYQVNQKKDISSNSLDLIVKHYWNITNVSQINTSISNHFVYDNYLSLDEQKMTDGRILNFEKDGFGNKLYFRLNDLVFSTHYKLKKGKCITNIGLYAHFYNWWIEQDSVIKRKKISILPDFSFKFKINGSSGLEAHYQTKVQFPQAQNLLGNYTLLNYYSISRGNPSLENELYHSASVIYTNFSIYHKLIMHIMISYDHKISGIIYQTKMANQKYFSYPVLKSNPESSWTFSAGINKRIKRIKFQLDIYVLQANYLQEINDILSKYRSFAQLFIPGISTNFKKWPNISISYRLNNNRIKGDSENYSMISTRPSFEFKYDFLKGFIFKSDFAIEFSKNKSTGQRNRFDMANASLYYQHKKSPWGFELSGSNIFDVDAKYNYSVSDYMAISEKTYIFPRLILFKLSYHL